MNICTLVIFMSSYMHDFSRFSDNQLCVPSYCTQSLSELVKNYKTCRSIMDMNNMSNIYKIANVKNLVFTVMRHDMEMIVRLCRLMTRLLFFFPYCCREVEFNHLQTWVCSKFSSVYQIRWKNYLLQVLWTWSFSSKEILGMIINFL